MEKTMLRDSLGMLDTEATRPIALREISDIYRARARRNKNMGTPIQGFEELLAGLHDYSGEAIVIHTLHSEQGQYKIFTNEAQTELASILKLPAQAAKSSVPSLSELQTA